MTSWVDDAARAAALATGTKVLIEHQGQDRDGISIASLDELAFAYMKMFGATGAQPQPGKPKGYEETGSVSSEIPGLGVTAKSSAFSNHTYGMEADALTDVGHQGFLIDAETMAAVLYDFATQPDYRDTVKKEFTRIHTLFGDYQQALEKAYPKPQVPDPK